MAVIMDHELEAVAEGEKSVDDATILLLRVPGGSLNPLKDYVEKKLLPKGGLLPYMLVTRLGFDTAAAHPKFAFKASRFLSEEEFGTVEELRESDIVKRIINEAAELEDGESTDAESDAGTTAHAGKPEATKSASPESSDEEEYSEEVEDEDDDDDIAPPPPPKKAAKKRAAAVEEEAVEEEDDDDIAPPPPPKKKAKTTKAVKAKESKPKSEEVESPDEDDDSVDDLLDRVLG
jgi:outer membrane biosynthesis protein TonB